LEVCSLSLVTIAVSQFRFCSHDGLTADIATCLFDATTGLMHRNKVLAIRSPRRHD